MNRSQLRIALRTLGRHRGFTAVAVVSLAIAIALNTTMYSVLDAMLYPRVAVRQPDHLLMFRYFGDYRRRLPDGAIEDALRAVGGKDAVFTGVTQGRGQRLAEVGPRYARVDPMVVRSNFFDVLGTVPRQGRTFIRGDEQETGAPAVISDRLAYKLYPEGSPIGAGLSLEGKRFTVIGVIERTSAFWLLSGDIWTLPVAGEPPPKLSLVRFHDRVEPGEVETRFRLASDRLASAVGETRNQTRFYGGSLAIGTFAVGPFQWALIAAVLAVLLVACANLANLQFARGLARSRELAIRAAVGASRRQLIEYLLLESAIVAGAGLVLGTITTVWTVRIARNLIPPSMNDILIEPQTSWRMFVFAASAALLCVILVGLVPALRISRVDPESLLKSGAGTGANRLHRRRYGVMVAAQIGLALPVMIGAFVLIKSAMRWRDPDYLVRQLYGYDPTHILVGSVEVPRGGHITMTLADIDAELRARAQLVPNIAAATVDERHMPARGPHRTFNSVMVDDVDGSTRELGAPLWTYHVVSPTYLRTFNRRIIQGRDFADGENDGTAIIVDSLTASFLWKHENPIGRAIKFGDAGTNEPWHRVVGVVADGRDTNAIRRADISAGNELSSVYRVVTTADTVQFLFAPMYSAYVSFAARASGNPELAAIRLQRELRSMSALDKPSVLPMESAEYGSAHLREASGFVSLIFSTFAVVGIALVAIGMFGIVAHSVAERRREIAVRISLGAQARDILRALLREGNIVLLIGVAVGLLLIRNPVWWLAGFIGENDGYDAIGFAAVAALLFAIAVVAAFIPALRATRIDPVEALRHE